MKMLKTRINKQWELLLPEHRAIRPEWKTGWEVERIKSMMKNIKDSDIVYDIGSEEGDMSALFARQAKGIYLFEPNPRVWPNIRAIWNANELTPPLNWFVGFASNKTDLNPINKNTNDIPQNGWPACAYGEIIGDHGFRHLYQEADATPQIKLDDFLIKYSALEPDIMTIDVDGSDFEVLKGAEKILTIKKPLIYISIHPEMIFHQYDIYENDLHIYMDKLGYKKKHLEFAHEHHWLFWHPEGRLPVES